jgi:hypothetical protein
LVIVPLPVCPLQKIRWQARTARRDSAAVYFYSALSMLEK